MPKALKGGAVEPPDPGGRDRFVGGGGWSSVARVEVSSSLVILRAPLGPPRQPRALTTPVNPAI